MFLKTNVVIISKIQQMKHKTFKSSVNVFFWLWYVRARRWSYTL